LGSLYSDHITWLHRVPAAFKLICFAVLGTAQFLMSSPTALILSALACCLLFASLGRAVYPARKLVLSIVLAGLLIIAFHAFMQQPSLGVVSALRLLSASLLGIALTLTTRFARRVRAASVAAAAFGHQNRATCPAAGHDAAFYGTLFRGVEASG